METWAIIGDCGNMSVIGYLGTLNNIQFLTN